MNSQSPSNMSHPSVDLDHLLHHKDFSALSEGEREAVLAAMSRESYETMRAGIDASRRYLLETPTGIQPRAATARHLRARMRRSRLAQSTFGAGFFQVFARPVPAYQAVAAGVLLVWGLHFLARPALDAGNPRQAVIMIADSTDSAKTRKVGLNLDEDTVVSRFRPDSM